MLVDRPIEQILERLEELLDRLLPASFDVEKVDASHVKEQTKIQRVSHLGKEYVIRRSQGVFKKKIKMSIIIFFII